MKFHRIGQPSSFGFFGFAFPDLLAIVAMICLLLAIILPVWANSRARSQEQQCRGRLSQISQAILVYADQNAGRLPDADRSLKGPVWWFYKEQVKESLGLRGPSSPADREFGCPADRGYDDGKPFRLSAKFDYTSYVFNGVQLPGVPNVAGRTVGSIRETSHTLLVMEWAAHAPLSWHRSRTGNKNQPYYNDAESVVAFVDGHVDLVPIYYDGINPAYTRDPIPGYRYKYSGD
jgi:prepilin-type processing-associated H-X9-DG protein